MPIYEYQCASCQNVHELIQKFSDPPLDRCPDCGGPVSKLMSKTSFALKGSGWYTTDYKRKSQPGKAAASSEGSSSASESKSEGGGESKSEAPKVPQTKDSGSGKDPA